MAFMQRQITCEAFHSGTDSHGECVSVPADVWGTLDRFAAEYGCALADCETVADMWWCRLSAPGYMDCTEWSGPYATEAKARAALSTLACGHEPSAHGAYTTGTAHLPDGREVCTDCADEWQRDKMRTSDTLLAYLSDHGTITTWTGGELARVTSQTVKRVGFGRTERVYLRATDSTGKRWHGCSPGPNMYAKLRASR